MKCMFRKSCLTVVADAPEVVREVVVAQIVSGDVARSRKLDLRSRTYEASLLEAGLFTDLRSRPIPDFPHHFTPDGQRIAFVQETVTAITW